MVNHNIIDYSKKSRKKNKQVFAYMYYFTNAVDKIFIY